MDPSQDNHQLRFLVGFGVDPLFHSIASTFDLVADYKALDYAVDTVVDWAVDR